MEIDLEKLIPPKPIFELNGKPHFLKPFTLESQLWVQSRFADAHDKLGYNNLAEKLGKLDALSIAELAYFQLEDKTDFKTLKNFVDSFKSVHEIIAILLPAINRMLQDSQPEDDLVKGIKEVKKSRARTIKKYVGRIFTTRSRKGMA